MHSLVSIKHPTLPHLDVPFINARGPFDRIVMPTWQVRSIEKQGFNVTVHSEPYDPVAARESKISQAVKAVVSQAAEVVDNVAEVVDSVADYVAEAAESVVSIAGTDSKVDETAEVVHTAAEAIGNVAEKIDEAIVSEGEQQPATAEEPTMTEAEWDSMIGMVRAFTTLNEAKQFTDAYSIVIPETLTRLKDIKAEILRQLGVEE